MRESKRSDVPLIRIVGPDWRYQHKVLALLQNEGWDVRYFINKRSLFFCDDMKRSGCFIIEASAPYFDGLKLQTEMIKEGINLPIIFISGSDDVDLAVRAIKAGAADYLLKPTAMECLADVVREVMNQPEQEPEVIDFKRNLSTLTNRERQILKKMSLGYSNREMSKALHISIKTLEHFRCSIRQKLGIQALAKIIYLFLKSEASW